MTDTIQPPIPFDDQPRETEAGFPDMSGLAEAKVSPDPVEALLESGHLGTLSSIATESAVDAPQQSELDPVVAKTGVADEARDFLHGRKKLPEESNTQEKPTRDEEVRGKSHVPKDSARYLRGLTARSKLAAPRKVLNEAGADKTKVNTRVVLGAGKMGTTKNRAYGRPSVH